MKTKREECYLTNDNWCCPNSDFITAIKSVIFIALLYDSPRIKQRISHYFQVFVYIIYNILQWM